MNPTGVLAPEAVEALRAIGFAEASGLIERAMAFFGSPYPRDQEVRVARLEELSGTSPEEWDPFFELDAEFDELLGPAHTPPPRLRDFARTINNQSRLPPAAERMCRSPASFESPSSDGARAGLAHTTFLA